MNRLLTALTALAAVFAHTASAADWFVATNGTGNGTNWANATNSLQGAINASSANDTVWVSNGVYEVDPVTGAGVTNWPAGTVLTNRVVINKAITVRSANNDPANTIIKGNKPYGATAVRCVYMVNGSSLIGFTLTNGATLTNANVTDDYGAGIRSPSVNTIISNCVIAGNAAGFAVGGAYYGTLFNCTLSGNSALYSGGAMYATLSNCTLVGNSVNNAGGGANACTLFNCTLTGNSAGDGGGAYNSTLNNCTIVGNSAGGTGGGAYNNTLYNCELVGNSAGSQGGGAIYGTLFNCTMVGNSAASGGGTYAGTLINSIAYFNSASNGSNWIYTIAFTNTCTVPAATNGPGNISADPRFIANGIGYGTNHVAGNYRLRDSSPCINAGTNFSWMTDTNDVRSVDLDGNPRIRHGTVDMGAYEALLKGTTFTFY